MALFNVFTSWQSTHKVQYEDEHFSIILFILCLLPHVYRLSSVGFFLRLTFALLCNFHARVNFDDYLFSSWHKIKFIGYQYIKVSALVLNIWAARVNNHYSSRLLVLCVRSVVFIPCRSVVMFSGCIMCSEARAAFILPLTYLLCSFRFTFRMNIFRLHVYHILWHQCILHVAHICISIIISSEKNSHYLS